MVGATSAKANLRSNEDRRRVLDHQHSYLHDSCLLSRNNFLIHLPVLATRSHLEPQGERNMHRRNSGDVLVWSHQPLIRHCYISSATVGNMAFANAYQEKITGICHLRRRALVSYHYLPYQVCAVTYSHPVSASWDPRAWLIGPSCCIQSTSPTSVPKLDCGRKLPLPRYDNPS